MKPKHFPLIPIMADGIFLEGNERRGAYAKLGKLLGESQVGCHFVGFPQGENYSRGIGNAWHPSKTKVGSCYNHKTNPEIGKKTNQWQPNIFLFPLTPTKARTIKLAQKLEKHPNQSKPCSTSGLLRGHVFKDIVLILFDPIWLCWKLFKFVPQLCNKADRLRAAAYDHLRLARNRLYRYHFDGNYSIFPYISLSSWNIFFWTQRMPE